MDKMGENWPWMTDTKSSDPRATFPYLLQELSQEYDRQPIGMKKHLEIAQHTGFTEK